MITDSGKYLLYADINDAVTANIQIFENYARTKPEVIRTATDEVIDPATIADGDLVAMVHVVPGYTKGALQSEGYTTGYATIHECVNGAGFVIPKPIDDLMTGVTYDSIEDRDELWYEVPEEEIIEDGEED